MLLKQMAGSAVECKYRISNLEFLFSSPFLPYVDYFVSGVVVSGGGYWNAHKDHCLTR